VAQIKYPFKKYENMKITLPKKLILNRKRKKIIALHWEATCTNNV